MDLTMTTPAYITRNRRNFWKYVIMTKAQRCKMNCHPTASSKFAGTLFCVLTWKLVRSVVFSFVCFSVYLSDWLSVCAFDFVSVCLCVCLSVCLPASVTYLFCDTTTGEKRIDQAWDCNAYPGRKYRINSSACKNKWSSVIITKIGNRIMTTDLEQKLLWWYNGCGSWRAHSKGCIQVTSQTHNFL